MINNNTNFSIFSGTANETLASDICSHLQIPLGDIYHHTFPSGESYCQIKENVRGKDVFLIQPTSHPANDNLMQLLVMVDAARRASAERITAVIPYFGYSRQDRKDKSRVPISAKLVLNLIEAAGVDRILTMDLHSPQICGFTNLPFDHLTFEPILLRHIKKGNNPNIIIMAPDVGAVKRAEKYASALKCEFGFISKRRVGDEQVEFQSIVGNVAGKDVIIIDDLTESCGTLIQAAEACLNNNANTVKCAVTHGAFTTTGMSRLKFSIDTVKNISQFIHSDTIDHKWTDGNKPDKIVKLSTAELFAKGIYRIHTNQSVSELF